MSPTPDSKDSERASPLPATETEPSGEKAAVKEKTAKGKAAPKTKAAKTPAAPEGKRTKKPIPDNPNFRYIVRFADSDLDGMRSTALALTGVRGVGIRVAEATCRISGVSPTEMIGNLPEATVDGLEELVRTLPTKVPPWVVNHRFDRATGESQHLIGADLETGVRDDVNQMKMIRSYKGVRHERGQKVRGQRTRSNGRTGMAAGVLKKAAKEAAAAAAAQPTAAAPAAVPAAPKAAEAGAAKK